MTLKTKSINEYNLVESTKIETEFGAVYQAQDLGLGRTVAVKQIKISGDSEKERKQNLEKARLEVRAIISLDEENLNIPRIYETYYDDSKYEFYIIMSWIKGDTLRNRMKTQEIQFVQWMIDLCEILDRMYLKHIYHKDIKPENIMIDRKNNLYLIDFNISLSTSNMLEGTVNYKAPEMSSDSKSVSRDKADMFSLGVLLYEYYAHKVPIRGEEYAKNRSRGPLVWDKFESPLDKGISINKKMNDIIIKCMMLDPKDRFSGYGELKNELRNALRGMKNERRKNNKNTR